MQFFTKIFFMKFSNPICAFSVYRFEIPLHNSYKVNSGKLILVRWVTEFNWMIKIKYPMKNKRKLEMRRDIIETLLEWNDQLKKEGYRHGIYNVKCYVVKGEFVDEKEPFTVMCTATTYGDIPWLKNVRKPSSVEVTQLEDRFDANERELEMTNELIKIMK